MITPDEIPDPNRPLDQGELEAVALCVRCIDSDLHLAGQRDDWPAVINIDDPGRRIRDEVVRRYRDAGWWVQHNRSGGRWCVTIDRKQGEDES